MSDTKPSVRFVNPPEIAGSGVYTHVVETTARRTIYISGQVALDKDGNIVGENDLRAQAAQVCENIKYALAAVGATYANVVKLNTFMTDITQIQVLRDVRRLYVNQENPPASTTVEVSRLFRPGLLIEMDATAVLADE
jgi:enamine deaminase RidA (YjgF/YER057c/UK114 family)